MSETLLAIGAGAGAVIALLSLIGIVFSVIKPWLREQLIEPIRQTHQQVTVNGGVSNPPTLKDEIGAVGKKVDTLSNDVRVLALAVAGQDLTVHGLEGRFNALEERLRQESAAPAA
jgi:hypothetical protein